MLSWLSRDGRVDLPDIKRISLLQALLLAGIAWYIHRIIKSYIAYQVCFCSHTFLLSHSTRLLFSLRGGLSSLTILKSIF